MKSLIFHGALDTYHAMIGHWQVTQERKHTHTVEHARHILYRFTNHTHPYAQRLVWELINGDIEGLQRLDTEVDLRKTFFADTYLPSSSTKIVPEVDPADCAGAPVAVVASQIPLPEDGLPVQDLDFDYQTGAYAVYNWEVFYHAPFTIGLHLSKNGRYEEAQRWFHYVFDPTDNSNPELGPKRFWKVKPFKIDEVKHIESVLFNLATGDDPVARDATADAIGAWRDNPFRPHLVARSRPSAYMYTTVMAYLDNLVAWGDSLFRQDTKESINEATQLYVLAANILGPRPQMIPSRGSNKKQTYASLKNDLDEFGNAAVRLEAEIAFDLFPPPQAGQAKPEHALLESIGRTLYFCVPRNEKLNGYWDTVADRLFKIRNSLNLQGAFRQLPLFAPPIDPAMLARAIAAGVDIGAVIDGSAEAIAPVRFQFLLQKALEIAQEVKSLGSQILAALEKKDGETLGVLRARHEVNMLDLVDAVKFAQWREAAKAREGVQESLYNAFQRFRHYDRLLGTDDGHIKPPEYVAFDRDLFETRVFSQQEPSVDAPDPEIKIGSSFLDGGHKISDEEAHEIDLLEAAEIGHEITATIEMVGAFLNTLPNVGVGPLAVTLTWGGNNLGHLFSGIAAAARGVTGRITYEAGLAGKMGGFARREQEWAHQRKSAAGELNQLYKQLRSAEIREYIAKREHEHHAIQIKQSKEVLEFLTNEQNVRTGDQRKTTTEDFYLWMKREAQGLHAKCFQFAYDVAKKAERGARFELGDRSLEFVQSSYLAGREGLFAGEKLYFDLKRMEMAFAEKNQREFELTKHVSLREWFPVALLTLRKEGKCEFALPEELFDLDCPGHSFRRIKSVAVSLPCVAGPYASINCSLTQGPSHVRFGTGGYGSNPDDANFTSFPAAVKSIVTSSAQGDTGLFETNLRDERYLPFEGEGVISPWSLELLGKPRSFDYDTIADAIITIRYTARAQGNRLSAEAAAEKWLKANSARAFSMRHEFPSEWAAFKNAKPSGDTKASLKFVLQKGHFPYRMGEVTEKAKRLHLFLAGTASGDVELIRDHVSLGIGQILNGTVFDQRSYQSTGNFELQFDSNTLDDLWLVIDWS